MDRYGEIYTTYNMILDAIRKVPTATVLLNGDSPLFYKPAIPNPVQYFGFDLEKGVNEQKVIRAYALLMTFSGVAIFISGFFSSVVALVLIVIFAITSTLLPFYLIKKYKG